jgi:hypothetical protein
MFLDGPFNRSTFAFPKEEVADKILIETVGFKMVIKECLRKIEQCNADHAQLEGFLSQFNWVESSDGYEYFNELIRTLKEKHYTAFAEDLSSVLYRFFPKSCERLFIRAPRSLRS